MFTFEMKKFMKSKKILFLLLFALAISFFSFFFTNQRLNLMDENLITGSHLIIDDFFEAPPSEEVEKGYWQIQEKYLKDYHGIDDPEKLLQEEKELYAYIMDQANNYPEILSKRNEERLDNMRWQIFKYEYMVENNADDGYHYQNSSYVHELIVKSSLLFGPITSIFFVLLFSDSFSREREEEHLNLLYIQPKSRKKLVLAKFSIIIFAIIIYIFSVLLFSSILSYFAHIPLEGFQDIYRILGSRDPLAYYTGFELLSRMLIVFFILNLFWSSLSLFLSSRLSSDGSLAFLLAIFAFLISLSPHIKGLRTFPNPLYAGQIVSRLLGSFVYETDIQGFTTQVLLAYTKLSNYLLFLVPSLLFIFFASFAPYEIASFASKEKKITVHSLFQLEMEKILHHKGLRIYLLGGLLLFSSFYFVDAKVDNDYRLTMYGDSAHNRIYKDAIDFEEKEIQFYQDILNGKIKPNMIRRSTGEEITSEVLNEKQIRYFESLKKEHQANKSYFEKKADDFDQSAKDYKENNSQAFYRFSLDYWQENFQKYASGLIGLGDAHTLASSPQLNNLILDQAKENKASPLLLSKPFFSPEDSYKDLSSQKRLSNGNDNIRSHTGPIYLYRLFMSKNLGLIILILLCLMVFHGYCQDKEKGRQLEFMYSSSLSRKNIHFTKIACQILFASLTLFFILAFILLLGGVSSGFDGWNFPVAIYAKEIVLIPIWQFLIRIVLTILALIFFYAVLMNLLSLFTKKKTQLFALTFLISFLGVFVSSKLPPTMKVLNPFLYLEVESFANLSIRIFENIDRLSFPFGLLVIVLWSLFLFFVGLKVVNKKKDVL